MKDVLDKQAVSEKLDRLLQQHAQQRRARKARPPPIRDTFEAAAPKKEKKGTP